MEKECEYCSGSGQLSFFKGVSRFLMSVEECPECAGLGFLLTEEEDSKKDEKRPESSPVNPEKN